MIVTTIGITVSPSNKEQALKVIVSLLGPTRAEKGCVSCDLQQDVEDDMRLTLLERWESMASLERHIRSDRFRRVLAWIDMSTQPPVVHFDSLSESQGLELIAAMRSDRH